MEGRRYLIIIYFITFLLQGCMNVATTGAQMVYNRHSIEKNIKDQYLTTQAYNALYVHSKDFNDTNISISTYHREMLLTGQTPHSWQKAKAERLIKQIPDIKKIYNLISIQSPSTPLIRMSDAWITAKIKAKYIASNDVDVTQIKVITENGVVYLMGVLMPEQAMAAIDLASHTYGVLSVVKIFSYIKISKTI